MFILMYIWNNISKFTLGVLSLFTYYTYKKNKELIIEKQELIKINNTNNKIIDVQKKVINVTKDYKPSSLDDNIKRMQDGKL